MLICVFQCVREAADYTRLPPPSSSSKCHLQLNDNDRHSDTVRRRRELRLGGEVGGGRHKKRLGPFFFGARGTKQHGSFECHPLHRDIEAHISFFFSYIYLRKALAYFFMLIVISKVRTGWLRRCTSTTKCYISILVVASSFKTFFKSSITILHSTYSGCFQHESRKRDKKANFAQLPAKRFCAARTRQQEIYITGPSPLRRSIFFC